MNNISISWIGNVFYLNSVIGINISGVLHYPVNPYCYTVEDFVPIENSIEAIAILRNNGHKIVLFNDQGGIEKGLYTTDSVNILHIHLLNLLGNAGCSSIDGIYYSTSSQKQDMYALPNVGMFKRCEKENKQIKFKEGYYVGTTIKDLKAAVKIGATPILVRTGTGCITENLLSRFTYRELKKRTIIYDSLFDFVNFLIELKTQKA